MRSITPVPILYLAAFCLLFAPVVRAVHAKSFAGKVVGVVDGDTIIVMREGSPKRVRLYGVDAPEISQDYGAQARKLVRALAGGRKVTVEYKGIDEYERILADVILSGRIMLNREIVRAGYAWCYESEDKILKRLQAQARKKKIGLWAGKEPVAPWVYRRLLKEQAERETSQTVYVTKTGKKYHRAGCRSLRKGRIPTTLEAAAEKGYEPCRICSPLPEAEGSPPGPGDEPDERLKPERVIYTGPRGGKYYYSKSGRKVYIKKK